MTREHVALMAAAVAVGTLFAADFQTASVEGERATLPAYNPKAAPWQAGYRPLRSRMWETSVQRGVVPESVKVRAADGRLLRRGVDFEVNDAYGAVGLVGEAVRDRSVNPVTIDYDYRLERLDLVCEDAAGRVTTNRGEWAACNPVAPRAPAGCRALGTVWTRGAGLPGDGEFFPSEGPFVWPRPAVLAAEAVPKTLAKLERGERVKVLAWGDSVTEMTYLHPDSRWQRRFVAWLRARYPQSEIELVELGWGGRTLRNYLDEPAGSPHEYKAKVLDERPDLVISEFVNDASFYRTVADVKRDYGRVLADLRAIGAEWVINTPHYVFPDWMGLKSPRDCDDDPRVFVKALREFAVENRVGLSDCARRWGHLWREGVPYPTRFVNGINHPDHEALGYYVEGLVNFFTSARGAFESAFAAPPAAARPWCYWWWQNGHADEASITADLEAMRALGFGGVLMSDSMGYWDDEDHIVVPKRETEVMGPAWRALVQHAIRECARLGIKFTLNTATSGGKLSGPWPVGADAPKRLMCRVYPKGAEFERTDFPFWQEIGAYEVFAADASELVDRGWFEAGDGTRSLEAHLRNVSVEKRWTACVDPKTAGARAYIVRFGRTVIPGHETDVDVLDPKAIRAHFNRFTGAIMDEAGAGLVGADRTVSGIYSVSWEGVVPQWSATFREDFAKFAGYDLEPFMPVLAGFVPAGTDPEKFTSDYRRARNDMFRENFYGTLLALARERGVVMYSENGGPWRRDPELFREADQLKYLALNDMPQGEFWVNERGGTDGIFNPNDRTLYFNTRGPVSAAHVYGKRLVSMESFTHMRRHYTLSPGALKLSADRVFADGANHIVWHTFSLSPDKFGVPGCEYFAGTHVNRNVTWHREAKGLVTYLTRCEALLQLGEPVVDIAVRSGRSPYAHWGRYRDAAPDGTKIPAGYNYDLVNDEEWEASTVADGWRTLRSGMRYPAERPAQPDLEGPFAFAHRRLAGEDLYFLEGSAKATAVFRVAGRAARLLDAVTGRVTPLATRPTADGRTAADLDLTGTGAAIVLFSDAPAPTDLPAETLARTEVKGPWEVSFAYHRLTHARHLPKTRTFGSLVDWTLSDDTDLRHFSGKATYRTTLTLDAVPSRARLALGALPTGVARVFVNGTDCGGVWCFPWAAEIPAGTLRKGANEIVVEYVNNWANRLIGDCSLPPEDRVTTSCLQLLPGSRRKPNGKTLNVHSGYCAEDPLQSSGLLGPVALESLR